MNPDIQVVEGDFSASDARVALIASRFNALIVDSLVDGAVDTLLRHGLRAANLSLIRVPGSWELPLAARRVANAGGVDALIVLGAVIRGGTPHFEYVAGECASGLARVQAETDLPLAFGVLTTEDIEQAFERAGTKAGNKGADAALTALEMVSLLRRLESR